MKQTSTTRPTRIGFLGLMAATVAALTLRPTEAEQLTLTDAERNLIARMRAYPSLRDLCTLASQLDRVDDHRMFCDLITPLAQVRKDGAR